MFNPVLLYCYDAYCGWCYGFSSVIERIDAEYGKFMQIEVLSGGLVLPNVPTPIGATASHIRDAYKQVEAMAGVTFGADYLWHINHPEESDWFPHSEKPAIALCIFKEMFPEKQVAFAKDLQYALHFEGRDLTDNQAYVHLLEKYAIDEEAFMYRLQSEEYKQKAYYEFQLCKQLKVSGFPAVLLQTSETKFYLAASGYSTYEALNKTLIDILKETLAK